MWKAYTLGHGEDRPPDLWGEQLPSPKVKQHDLEGIWKWPPEPLKWPNVNSSAPEPNEIELIRRKASHQLFFFWGGGGGVTYNFVRKARGNPDDDLIKKKKKNNNNNGKGKQSGPNDKNHPLPMGWKPGVQLLSMIPKLRCHSSRWAKLVVCLV